LRFADPPCQTRWETYTIPWWIEVTDRRQASAGA
jgi:hypothetical protein